MAVSPELRVEHPSTVERAPDIVVCETCPGRNVFLESGNTDGWISSDVTVPVLE
ncbi:MULTISPECIES: hypothetical protein [unclassified Haladaptatus]|uniref:hypothetical protein n=1 Tax=unclassified Haladaptatus TaxID=2622732 RepID=UPI0023E82E64|nr:MULTISPECIES: hypothetical protein [unclassified Haladaptatus]